VEEGRINICYLANYETFKTHKSIDAYEQEVVRKNPLLNEILDRVTPAFERPLTISQISFSAKENVCDHVLMSGDSAGMIHPLCGNGMGMAIVSAQLLSTAILAYFAAGQKDRTRLEQDYTRHWQSHFQKRLLFGRAFNTLFYRPQLFAGAISLLTIMPGMLPFFIRQTHGEKMS
jgi:flavin-dependent dehydrogenase